ncbi:hypothetical protein QBC47DRAFT_389079 [Echria macrotheca]|uniref:C2H2-type domain-containing protein n=1 Tax=Echria macrotheca TaxID=438768 RepID=A0AAJ0B9J7_9PEZI|nr:hypothetical protein QBC47DRAFT_389079 [Echria macrotheca]
MSTDAPNTTGRSTPQSTSQSTSQSTPLSTSKSTHSSSSSSILPGTSTRSPEKRTRPPRIRKYARDYPGCGYACSIPKDLRKHQVKHYGPNTDMAFHCPNSGCGKVFGRKENGRRHAARHCRYRPR